MLRFSGGDSEVATPVPIPNTVVKHLSGDGTAPARVWESSTLPGSSEARAVRGSGLFFYSKFLETCRWESGARIFAALAFETSSGIIKGP